MTTLTTRLEEAIRSEMERNRIPGLAIALIRGDEVVFAEGYGVTSIEGSEPVTPETRFAIMSVTKPIVVTAMMQLRDAGHFMLDDPANRHLAPQTEITNEWEAESPVTIRQLMTHSAGLPVTTISIPAKLSLAEFVKTFARTSRRPGTEIIYANQGFDAMGVLIEKFSGAPYDVYLRDHIFEPLGMSATSCSNPVEGEPHATGHFLSTVDGVVRTLPLPDWWTTIPSPAGACWSNVGDVASFLIAHLNGGAPIISPETTSEMQRLQFRQTGDRFHGTGQGLGFRVTDANWRKLICHGGDGSGFTAFAAAHPEQRAGVVLLMNGGGMQTARSVIGAAALRALEPDPRVAHGPEATLPEPGIYKSTFWDIELEARGDMITPISGLVLAGENPPSKLLPTDDYFFEASGGMFDGFEVSVHREVVNGEWQTSIYGGVYPFTFIRTGDLPEEQPIDESADLIGTWHGKTQTPVGPLVVTVKIESSSGTIDTPFAQGLPLGDFAAENGRLAGEFTMQVPGIGETQMFLRLEFRGSRIVGKTHARSSFGEIAMDTELERA